MLQGINHITIAVSDLARSIHFYQKQLGMTLNVKWPSGAYLSVGGQWICLSLDEVCPSKDYSHIAFDIAKEDFQCFCDRLMTKNIELWKQNKSEGNSLYLLDPDGHKLEIHVGDLASRLLAMKVARKEGVVFYE
jgi:catechol 2,3-dioxygenase-like lactoylglutathione lyase family enzyme